MKERRTEVKHTVCDGHHNLPHQLSFLQVWVLSVQHNTCGPDLPCGAVDTVEFIWWPDAVQEGAIFSQVRIKSHHL